ncbi:unnamed protein product [Vicia faba]|uniref:Uncharacterized protein n=1 Tax=Vicia faba TaxID=3906 RepID=A0AAV1AAY3_VICFA|nr:unnamed protein product [Vicia faba]
MARREAESQFSSNAATPSQKTKCSRCCRSSTELNLYRKTPDGVILSSEPETARKPPRFTKMNSAQVIAFQPGISVKNSKSFVIPMTVITSFPRIQSISIRDDERSFRLKSLKPLRAGGKGIMGNNDEDSPWKSLSNAMDKFKGQSIEEVLRKQIQKGEVFDNGGSGLKPPGGGGDGGGGDGSPDGTGGFEDEDYDTRQVILASGALISLYIYLIRGKELQSLFLDFLKYLVGRGQSNRLQRAMVKLGKLYRSIKLKKVTDEYFLEKAILSTPTWWYDPNDFRRAVRNYYLSEEDE